MEANHPLLQGLWLPLITPFRKGALDEASVRRLVRHYAMEPLDGLILAATTGEGLTLDEEEVERLVALAAEALAAAGRRLPIFLGLSGSDTRKVAKALVPLVIDGDQFFWIDARLLGWGLIGCPGDRPRSKDMSSR